MMSMYSRMAAMMGSVARSVAYSADVLGIMLAPSNFCSTLQATCNLAICSCYSSSEVGTSVGASAGASVGL